LRGVRFVRSRCALPSLPGASRAARLALTAFAARLSCRSFDGLRAAPAGPLCVIVAPGLAAQGRRRDADIRSNPDFS
jgi:hypothetical protein